MEWLGSSFRFSQDPFSSNNHVLIHGNGANGSQAITDSSPSPKTITVRGTTAISTAQSMFGGSSIYFDGSSGQGLSVPGFVFSGGFTWEMFVMKTRSQDEVLMASFSDAASPQWLWRSLASGRIQLEGWGLPTIVSTLTIPNNTWTHIAISQIGTLVRQFINGQLSGQANVTTYGQSAGVPITFGYYAQAPSTALFRGSLDEIRLTKTEGRYSANFTVPAQPFPDL
jgi:hypothetical protein